MKFLKKQIRTISISTIRTSKYPGVSSTMVYELYKKGCSIKEYLPYDAKLLEAK